MGYEIRRVPMGYEFPRNVRGDYQPHFNQSFREASEEWIREFDAWRRGERPDYYKAEGRPADHQFWEWHGEPPGSRECYRPDWKPEEMTGWVLYETVTEGTPESPIFATPGELVDWLVEGGTFMDREMAKRPPRHTFLRVGPWPRERAEAIVAHGSAPTFVMTPERGLQTGAEALASVDAKE